MDIINYIYIVQIQILSVSSQLGKDRYLLIFLMFSSIMFLFAFIVMYHRKKAAETKLIQQNRLCQYMDTHDALIDLYNRKYLLDYLRHCLLKEEKKMTVLYAIELFNLKIIQDTYGHEIGNRVLRHMATILKEEFDNKEECIAVDYTTFLISDRISQSITDVEKRSEKLIESLSKSIKVDYLDIELKVNMGIAVAPTHAIDASKLLKTANIALVVALKEGPNYIRFFEPALYKNTLKRITLEKQLRRAIMLGELVLFYQPKVDIKKMEVNGCEALIRWNHPDGKMVYPNTFIPLAEEVGLIADIGRWVMNESTNQVKQWAEKGKNIKVSINVSGKEFDDVFIDELSQMISKKNIDPGLIEVEITETAALEDIGHSKELIETLHQSGLSVSLDDFGAGYSSMLYIKKLKAGKLKIDKSFIDNLEDYEQKVVVASMIQLGKKLDYIINIEGVETKKQLEILKRLGVDEVQGWLFSKALPAEAFIKFVDSFKEYEYSDYQEIN